MEIDENTGLLPMHVRSAVEPRSSVGALVCRDDRLRDSWRAFMFADEAEKLHNLDTERQYQLWRFLHGCGEGHLELAFEKSIPLENNLDLQNGVSFNKGCYLGQELIARAHHVGMVRKRLWPVWLGDAPPMKEAQKLASLGVEDIVQLARRDATFSVPRGTYSLQDSSKECGRIIAVCREYPRVALAALRVAHAKSESIMASDPETSLSLSASPLNCAPWAQSVLETLQ